MSIHPATRLGPVHLVVARLDGLLEFYQRLLGLSLHWRKTGEAGLGAGGEDLVRLVEGPGARRVPGTTGLYHLAVLFPDRRDLARALARLFAARYPNAPTDHVMTETTYLDDPEGNGIELYVDTPEDGTWTMTGGRFMARDAQGNLRSGRDPLDVRALLALLRPGEPVDVPAPRGTKIGHVHLHVADLDAAVDFYHGVLGFDVMGRMDSAAFLSAGGYHHHIGLNTWAGEGAPPPPPAATGLQLFTVVLPDRRELERVEQALRAGGISAESCPEGIRVLDPSRNTVLLRGAEPLPA
jgi:catechol 2,3-dioxygenase